ncbi:MAG TPA: Crp/Fnr family transcriptional regulator [Nitrospirota bacterium]|nr:Crp/Fnr family transcriptional regulator [Nitrospirota bacterium]
MLVDYLKNIPLFRHLKETQLKEIASRCKTAKYRKNEVVFYKTDLSTDLYIVNSGRLKAVLIDEEGDEIVLAHFEKGSFFGELNLLDEKGRSATIAAETDSELSVLKKDLFIDLLFKDPRIAVELMTTIVDRLRKADEMIESLAFREVGERLIKALLDQASSNPAGASASYFKAGKITHKELSARIGSSREAVSKCLKVLASKAIVKDADGSILIARNALERFKNNTQAEA